MPEAAPNLPSSFGLDDVQTLARVSDPSPAIEHAVFWQRFKRALHLIQPELVERTQGGNGVAEPDPSDPTCTHAFESIPADDHDDDATTPVRIGARLLLPARDEPVRAGIVALHGYTANDPLAQSDARFARCLDRGTAVLLVRIRGYAGSRLDFDSAGDDSGAELGPLSRGFDATGSEPDATLRWFYPQAVADAANAARALRWFIEQRTNQTPMIMFRGESFGGGLAIAAAAVMQGREHPRTSIARLVIGLPSMGDWPWRLGSESHEGPHTGTGAGAEIARLIEANPQHAEAMTNRLRVCDSLVLARRIRCPVLCKLALRDEVVPAPTAAAIFNSIASDPGSKWRFVVPIGHADSDRNQTGQAPSGQAPPGQAPPGHSQAALANARRHAEFDRLAAAFLDPEREPAQVMTDWEVGRLDEPRSDAQPDSLEPPRPTTSGPQPSLFQPGDDETPEDNSPADPGDARLVAAYEQAGRTLDDLPYTAEFERLVATLSPEGSPVEERESVFRRLHNLRKAGKLPRLGRSPGKAVKLNREEETHLAELVTQRVGALSRRDRLPYTPAFDELVERFNADAGRSLGPHEVWRAIARLAK